jgi:hypothetical protein
MFRIDLAIAQSSGYYGLQALDERRRLCLPDGTTLAVSNHRTVRWFNVTEEFARQHFPYDAAECSAEVPLPALNFDDVMLDVKTVRINEVDMTDERAMELFAAYYVKEDVSCCG